MQVRRSGTPPRKYKAIERLQPRVEPVDLVFQPRDLFFRDSQQRLFRAGPLRLAQIGAHVEQIILAVPKKRKDLGILYMQVRQADDGIGFINAAESRNAEME